MSTEQTTAPLERMPANGAQETLWQITERSGARMVLDPPYQRGSVWGERRRRNLIRSMLLGIPVGAVFINERPDFTDAVVDGKQRIETIRAFFAGDLPVPASWFPAEEVLVAEDTADGPYVRFAGLSERGQGRFTRCGIMVQRTRLETVEEEAALFDLINFGGVPQGESDL